MLAANAHDACVVNHFDQDHHVILGLHDPLQVPSVRVHALWISLRF
jgi:hypothetical protein